MSLFGIKCIRKLSRRIEESNKEVKLLIYFLRNQSNERASMLELFTERYEFFRT